MSAAVENQAAVDRVEGDPRGILKRLEWVWDVIDNARTAKLSRHDETLLELGFSADDIAFIGERLAEGNATTRGILAEDLHPQVRREQEESLALGQSASEELRRWAEAHGISSVEP